MLSAIPVLALFAAVCLQTLPAERGDQAALSGLWRLWPVAVALAGAASISAPAVAPDPVAGALALAAGVVLLVAAFWLDARQADPVFPRRSFRFDAVGLGMWVLAIVSFAHYFAQPYVALSLQEQFRLSATWVGAGSVVLALSWSGAAILTAGRQFDRWRPAFTFGGPAAVVVGEGITALGAAQSWLAAVITGQAIIGVGFAVLWGPVTQAVMAAAPEGERDRAGGIMPTIASLGSAVGAGAGSVMAMSTGLPAALQQPGGGPAMLQWGLAAVFALVAVIAGLGQYRASRRPNRPPHHLTLPTPSAKYPPAAGQ